MLVFRKQARKPGLKTISSLSRFTTLFFHNQPTFNFLLRSFSLKLKQRLDLLSNTRIEKSDRETTSNPPLSPTRRLQLLHGQMRSQLADALEGSRDLESHHQTDCWKKTRFCSCSFSHLMYFCSTAQLLPHIIGNRLGKKHARNVSWRARAASSWSERPLKSVYKSRETSFWPSRKEKAWLKINKNINTLKNF